MGIQPRHAAGSRRDQQPAGGQFASKGAPTIKDDDLGFNTEPAIGPPNDWTTRKVKLWGLSTTFRRVVGTDGVVSVTTDCDPPDMMLLARKGDIAYWSGDTWSADHQARQLWCADIAAQMIEEGLVCVANSDGIAAAMALLGR